VKVAQRDDQKNPERIRITLCRFGMTMAPSISRPSLIDAAMNRVGVGGLVVL
jgi:hypothetical protein